MRIGLPTHLIKFKVGMIIIIIVGDAYIMPILSAFKCNARLEPNPEATHLAFAALPLHSASADGYYDHAVINLDIEFHPMSKIEVTCDSQVNRAQGCREHLLRPCASIRFGSTPVSGKRFETIAPCNPPKLMAEWCSAMQLVESNWNHQHPPIRQKTELSIDFELLKQSERCDLFGPDTSGFSTKSCLLV